MAKLEPKPFATEGIGHGVREAVAPASLELVIGLVGYAGAGCTLVAEKLEAALHLAGYQTHRIRLSDLIVAQAKGSVPTIASGVLQGPSKLERAKHLQDLGDQLRDRHGHHAVASLAIQEVRKRRGEAKVGTSRKAFILDSLKHHEEVKLLREVYEGSFRLVAVHCERLRREKRLIGDLGSQAKYRGADKSAVIAYMDRDEKDENKVNGQQVREAFYLADYFLDNNWESPAAARLNFDLDRFKDLLLGIGLVRPRPFEAGMYHAYAAGLKSSCLSRQVGAALLSETGELLAVGANEVPRFGGSTYSEGESPDCRCFAWNTTDTTGTAFRGCHNSRKKRELRDQIGRCIAENFAENLAEIAHPRAKDGADIAAAARRKAQWRSNPSSRKSLTNSRACRAWEISLSSQDLSMRRWTQF
jgi:deoxycytidylate deaminase